MPKKKKQELVAYKPIEAVETKLIKLDLGCGKRKVGADWIGVDVLAFDGVDVVFNLADSVSKDNVNVTVGEPSINGALFAKWPWEDNSVDEVHCSHFIEHLNAPQRAHFVNELYRVLKPGAKATIICPNWASRRAYGDLTHMWPPVSDFWFFYLDKNWRESQAPHDNFYKCDFGIQWGFALSDSPTLNLQFKNDDYKTWATNHLVNAAEDINAIFIKR